MPQLFGTERLYGLPAMAEALGISPPTVRDLVLAGVLEAPYYVEKNARCEVFFTADQLTWAAGARSQLLTATRSRLGNPPHHREQR